MDNTKCTTTKQGYPTLTTQHDCRLSHTGFDLAPFLVLAVMFVLVGVILWRYGRGHH